MAAGRARVDLLTGMRPACWRSGPSASILPGAKQPPRSPLAPSAHWHSWLTPIGHGAGVWLCSAVQVSSHLRAWGGCGKWDGANLKIGRVVSEAGGASAYFRRSFSMCLPFS